MLKIQLEASKHFSDYLEQEPYVRELLNAYMSSNFKTVLDLLTRYSVRSCFAIMKRLLTPEPGKALPRCTPIISRTTTHEYDTQLGGCIVLPAV